MGVLWSTLRSDIALLLLYWAGWVVTKVYSGSREQNMDPHHLIRGVSMSHWRSTCGMGYIMVAFFGKYNLPQPPNNNSSHQMGGEYYSSSMYQWRKATIIIVSPWTFLMEMKNPSFTFAMGAAIMTPCGPNGYNWLDQSYALDPSKAYQSFPNWFHFGLGALLNWDVNWGANGSHHCLPCGLAERVSLLWETTNRS